MNTQSNIQTTVMNIATGLILGFIWLGFAIFFGHAVRTTLMATDTAPVFSDSYIMVANTLMGAVIAILAASKLVEPTDVNAWATVRQQIGGAISIHIPRWNRSDWRAVIGLLYFVAYLILGLGAIVGWVTKSGVLVDGESLTLVPGLVQTYATVFLGSVIPVGIRFFTE